MCEDHQTPRADLRKKSRIFSAPAVLKCATGGAQGGVPPCGRVQSGLHCSTCARDLFT